jgi:hypothetical protein
MHGLITNAEFIRSTINKPNALDEVTNGKQMQSSTNKPQNAIHPLHPHLQSHESNL